MQYFEQNVSHLTGDFFKCIFKTTITVFWFIFHWSSHTQWHCACLIIEFWLWDHTQFTHAYFNLNLCRAECLKTRWNMSDVARLQCQCPLHFKTPHKYMICKLMLKHGVCFLTSDVSSVKLIWNKVYLILPFFPTFCILKKIDARLKAPFWRFLSWHFASFSSFRNNCIHWLFE